MRFFTLHAFKGYAGHDVCFHVFLVSFFDHNLYKTFIVLVGILGTLAYLDHSQRPTFAKPHTGATAK